MNQLSNKNKYSAIKKINLLAYLLLFFTFSTSSLLFSQNLKDLRILHYNDFHAANVPYNVNKFEVPEITDSVMMVGGAAYIKAYINKNTDLNTILLNAGDIYQGGPASAITKGKSQIIIENYMNSDVVTLGNHEFDYTTDTLISFLKLANFKIICCNIVDKKTKKPLFDPYKIITKNGIKIAVIGVITEELPRIVTKTNIDDLQILDIIPTVKKQIAKIKEMEKPNLIILLTHVGYEVDKHIAEAIPEVNVIIGGHSHSKIPHPAKHNNTIICQAHEKGKYLGVLDLKVDIKNNSVHSFLGKLVPIITDYIQPDTTIIKVVDSINAMWRDQLNEVVGELKTDWIRTYKRESNIGNCITDIIRDFSESDVAFYNAGGIRKDLYAGPITVKDIWEIVPFDNSVVSFNIRGDSLYNIFEYQFNNDNHIEILQISGAEYKYNLKMPKGKRVVELKINKQKIDPSKYYKIVTNSFLISQSKQYLGINIDQYQIHDSGIFIKELFVDYVRKQKVIDSKIENRIVQIQ